MEENSRTQGQVYQLRIQLSGISPPIWRRILVAADCTIAELHQTIQLVMGWTDEHLHRFTIRGQWYGVPREGGLCFFAGSHRLRLAEFDFRAHERFRYEYDFHSDWVHDIRVEKILPRASVRHVPVCIAGVGACPPEDSGPPDRFMATLDEHSGFDFMTWLEDELEKPGLDRAALRQALSDWRPWLDRRFDRKAANARLNAG